MSSIVICMALPAALLNVPRFFDTLRLAQRPAYADYDEWLSVYGDPKLSTIYDDEWHENVIKAV